jgi:hypothetical protein
MTMPFAGETFSTQVAGCAASPLAMKTTWISGRTLGTRRVVARAWGMAPPASMTSGQTYRIATQIGDIIRYAIIG